MYFSSPKKNRVVWISYKITGSQRQGFFVQLLLGIVV